MDIEALERMLEQGRESAMLRFTLGNACFREERWDEAISHYQRALTLDPAYSAAWQSLGDARARAGVPDDEVRQTYADGLDAARERGDMQVVKVLEARLRKIDRRTGG